jgi:hypothetical protein
MAYGSLDNLLMGRGTIGMPEPQVGSGVTKIMWTDRSPYEVVRIEGKKVFIKPCKVVKDKPESDYGRGGDVIQTAYETEIRKNKKGQWIGVTGGRMNGQIYRIEMPGQKGGSYYDRGF